MKTKHKHAWVADNSYGGPRWLKCKICNKVSYPARLAGIKRLAKGAFGGKK